MKRKPLSPTKLEQYLQEFIFHKYATKHKRKGEDVLYIPYKNFELSNKNMETIKEFIEYIWWNPK